MLEYAKDVKPANPEAEKLARAIIRLINADKNLFDARKRVPHYTGQYEHEDFYADESEAWNRAADELYELIGLDSSGN